MEKIKFITDTACDIPLSTALAQGVEEAPLTVTVLGRTYRESYDISPQEFYDLCGQSKELPVSAGVNSTEYLSRLERAILLPCAVLLMLNEPFVLNVAGLAVALVVLANAKRTAIKSA